MLRRARLAVCMLALAGASAAGEPASPSPVPPNVLLLTVDTLRADHLSAYGYARPTSPHIDRLMAGGARFETARTIEPLTSPALASMITSRYPHEHGSSRNGLRIRSGLASLPRELGARGYTTAAFVGSWVLRDRLCGLGEHFELYEELLTRKRWLGLVRGEATGDDLTERAAEWIAEQRFRPWLAWVHYSEPHAPYRAHPEHARALGIDAADPDAVERYDMEIAFVDRTIGELLERLSALGLAEDTIVVFLSDHGESLGEHGYFGHGRQVWEPELRIPFAIRWPGHVAPQVVGHPSVILDAAPTVLGLIGIDPSDAFQGFDWSGVLRGGPGPPPRITRYQAHRAAVLSAHESRRARIAGLLEVAVIDGTRKEIYRPERNRRLLFDLSRDAGELAPLETTRSRPSEGLLDWLRIVERGLEAADLPPPEAFDEESVERLRALGYLD